MRIFRLLKKIARSFYLTIWWLPSRLRGPVALAYLLARTSDTIADEGQNLPSQSTDTANNGVVPMLTSSSISHTLSRCASAAPCSSSASATLKAGSQLSFSEREKILVFLKLVAEGKANILFFWKKSEQWKHFSKKEQKLIRQLPEMLQLLQSEKYSAFEAGCIKEVWQTILEGQLIDLRHQRDQKKFSAYELEEYLYLVAGCVGRFLTELVSEAFPAFATISLETMQALAIDYGKGLQLVNILRDFSEDQKQGRLYFSEEEKNFYHAQASIYLQQGEVYVKALRSGCLKVAYALPFLLGQQTLALLKKYPNEEKLKISRWRVYAILLRALQFLF
ncbi:MAG: hypothetical protein FJ390_02200 [Verrucomicrobia bacterium]|nr:hypothetical protein [Verrucomicrobiota bacterium]